MKPGGVIKWRKGSLKQQRNVQKLCFCPNSHPEGEVMLFKVQYGWAIKVWREKKRQKKKKLCYTVGICFGSFSNGCLEKTPFAGLLFIFPLDGWV